jgi:hypothetical protein
MTDANVRIAEALFERLKSLVLDEPVPIAWPFKDFTPPSDGPWLRPTFLPAQPASTAVGEGADNRFVGFVQIDVFYPAGAGLKRPLVIADAVAAHFKRGLVLDAAGFLVSVDRPPFVMSTSRDGAQTMTPVRVYYTADAPNPA